MSIVRSKKKTAILVLAAAVLILAALLILNNKTAPESSFVMEGKNVLSVIGEVTAVSNSSSLVYCMQDLLIEAQGENIRAKDIKGDIIWSQRLSGKIEKIADTGKGIVITDSINNINYYSLKGELLWTYKPDYEIIDVFVENGGSFLVEGRGMGGSHAEIFKQNGDKLGRILVENAYILSFSARDDAFSISIFDTSSEIIKTKIITYNFKGDLLWAHNYDNMIISKLCYNKDNKLIAIGENKVYRYEIDGSLSDEAIMEGKISNAAISEYLITIALHNKGSRYLVCYDANMREQSRKEIKDSPLGIYPIKNNYLLYYKDELMVITSKGRLTARFKANTDISSAYMTSDNKVYIVSSRRLQLLEYIK